MAVKLPLGKDIFPKVRGEGCYYIDKTEIIKKILNTSFDVLLITRPRRFGKSLTMSMLEDFFDSSRDSRADFEGLKISTEKELCEEWQNQWPVISVTLKKVEGRTFESAYEMLKVLSSNICKQYAFLGESEFVDEDDRTSFKLLKSRRGEVGDVKNCLELLIRMMHAHYGKPAIVLIDEYDVPLAKADEHGYYDEMLEIIRALFEPLKSNTDMKFAIVTGCLKIVKESIFTGTNNFVEDSITGKKLDEYIGFTEPEVEKLLEDAGLSDHAWQIKEWYDGYLFGSVNVYCPWDVLSYMDALYDDPAAEPESYWLNTSGNTILKRLLKKAADNETVRGDIDSLMEGGSIRKRISHQITYNEIGKSANDPAGNLWSVLYLTGYLTKKGNSKNKVLNLVIPNKEIHDIFVTHIMDWMTETISGEKREKLDALCDALGRGDEENVQKCFDSILDDGISVRDSATKAKRENFYHGVLLGLLMCVNEWCVQSNAEDGDGYSDIHVEIKREDKAFIIEVKYAEDDRLEAGCKEAMEQIKKKRYTDSLKKKGFSTIYTYGIACFQKHCKVVCETV